MTCVRRWILVRCTKCNSENDADSKFCDQCGTPLITSSEIPSQPGAQTQAVSAKHYPENMRRDAGLLSIFCPGLGHIYLELYARGAAFLGISIFIMLGSIVVGNVITEFLRGLSVYGYNSEFFQLYRLGALFVAVIWMLSIADAITQADNIKKGVVKQNTFSSDMKTFILIVFIIVGLLFVCPMISLFFSLLTG